MDNIFDVITAKSGKPREADTKALQALDKPQPTAPQTPKELASSMPVKELVKAWQANPGNQDYTKELLNRMSPTMTAAISSYAPGSGDKFSVKAAKLTLEALKAYDPKYGAEPSTYVFNNLKRLNRLAGQSGNIVKTSETRALERKLVIDASTRFEDDNGREPTLEELADITGLSKKKVDSLLDTDMVVPESSTLTENLHDTVTNADVDDNDCFEYVYASVGPIDKKIMEWTSGKHGRPVLSNNEIAFRLKVSPAAISQRKSKIGQLLSDVRGLI